MDVVDVWHQAMQMGVFGWIVTSTGPLRKGLALCRIRMWNEVVTLNSNFEINWKIHGGRVDRFDYEAWVEGRNVFRDHYGYRMEDPTGTGRIVPGFYISGRPENTPVFDAACYVPIERTGLYLTAYAERLSSGGKYWMMEYSFCRQAGTRVWSGERERGGMGVLRTLQADARASVEG